MADDTTFVGMAELQRALAASPAVVLTVVGGSLYREGNRIMTESKRIVPVKNDILRPSGVVFEPEIDPAGVSVTLGYGGAASAYAVIQHENLHFKHHGGQQAHYLLDPMDAAAPGYEARLAADVAMSDLFPGVV